MLNYIYTTQIWCLFQYITIQIAQLHRKWDVSRKDKQRLFVKNEDRLIMIKCLRILVAVLDVSNILVFGNLKRLFGPWKDNSFLRKLFPTSSSAQVAFTIPFYKMCKKSHIILIAWHHIILMRRVSLKVYPFFPLPPVNFNLLFFYFEGKPSSWNEFYGCAQM